MPDETSKNLYKLTVTIASDTAEALGARLAHMPGLSRSRLADDILRRSLGKPSRPHRPRGRPAGAPNKARHPPAPESVALGSESAASEVKVGENLDSAVKAE